MKRLVKWFLAPAVLMVGLAFLAADQAEAARWRVYYPGYRVAYAPYAYPAYYPGYYVAARPVRVHVYRPAPVVVYPSYYYAPAPVVAPPCVPYYSPWW